MADNSPVSLIMEMKRLLQSDMRCSLDVIRMLDHAERYWRGGEHGFGAYYISRAADIAGPEIGPRLNSLYDQLVYNDNGRP